MISETILGGKRRTRGSVVGRVRLPGPVLLLDARVVLLL